MKMKRRIAGFCLLLVLVFAPHAHAQGVRTIFLVRHADKVDDAPDALLSEEGHRRAECLAKTLTDTDIQQIYVYDLQRTQPQRGQGLAFSPQTAARPCGQKLSSRGAPRAGDKGSAVVFLGRLPQTQSESPPFDAPQ